MGLGHSHYPVPWGALKYDTSLGGFRTNITEQQLKDAPQFSERLLGETEIGRREPYYSRKEDRSLSELPQVFDFVGWGTRIRT